MKKLFANDIFKSAWLWCRTNKRPTIEVDPNNPNSKNLCFVFEDTIEIRRALNEFITDHNGVKHFVECYKNLRQELYMRKAIVNGKEGGEVHENRTQY